MGLCATQTPGICAEGWRGCGPADYLLVVVVALVLSMANVVGYTKCSKEASQQLRNLAAQAVSSGFTARTALAPLVLVPRLAGGRRFATARGLRHPAHSRPGLWLTLSGLCSHIDLHEKANSGSRLSSTLSMWLQLLPAVVALACHAPPSGSDGDQRGARRRPCQGFEAACGSCPAC